MASGSVNQAAVAAYWEEARSALLLPATPIPDAWGFGNTEAMADELLALVLQGTKTATTGALWEYEAEDEALPRVGDLSIVLDGKGCPTCVTEVTQVRILPMSDVSSQFAYDEGEGDRSLAWWRDAHERFFRTVLPTIKRAFAPDMPVVLERFILRYPALL